MCAVKYSEAFDKKFKVWKNNLLDMSHRNQQLYYKPKSRTTLEIIHPPMFEIFDLLVIKQKEFKFPIVFEPTILKQKGEETEEAYKQRLEETHKSRIEEMKNSGKQNEFITELTDKQLERLIKTHRKRAKDSLEEQGVNILYICFGLLKWYETQQKGKDKEAVYTPLLYVPIDLYRKRVLDNYRVKILDDEVLINPSLKEHFRSQFNQELPEFPAEYNLEECKLYFQSFRNLLSSSPKTSNWEIAERTFIGLFSFAKHPMYTDLVEEKQKLYNSKIIRAIAEGGGFQEDPKNIPNENDYTDNAEPLDSYHIIDCDSSQFKAIQYAKKGSSMVIRGPPGTGKSQAISNIIAECLSADKSVLFVAEKRAALDVVKRRLDKCGIGEFCLELHSDKANKVEVLKQIDRSLKSELKEKEWKQNKYKALKIHRQRLNEYLKSIHEPLGKTGTSLYQRIGEYDKLSQVPLIDAIIMNPLSLSDEDLFHIEDYLAQLDVYKEAFANLDQNPWSKSGLIDVTDEMKNSIYDDLKCISDYSKRVQQPLAVIETQYNLKPMNDLISVKAFMGFFASYNEHALDLDLSGWVGSDLKKGDRKKLAKQLEKVVKNIDKKKDPEIYASTIHNFKIAHLLEPFKNNYSGLERDFTAIFEMVDKISLSKAKLKMLLESTPIQIDNSLSEWKKNISIAEYWLSNMDSFKQWVAIQGIIEKLKTLGLGDFIEKLKTTQFELKIKVIDLFNKCYLNSWILEGMRKFPNLSNFNPKYHREVLEQFKILDDEIIKINRYRLAKKLFNNRPKQNFVTAGLRSSESNILTREMMKKRNIKPLRTILSLTKNYIIKVKPCFLMSPLSVSKFLDKNEFMGFFDVVIFDEASQVAPEDAIGSIMRGKQLIVVGDEKQLPPTSFFSSNLYDSMDDFASDVDTFDSILEECTGIGLPTVMLNYHYRSKKEGLIAFSNYHFYDNNLYTFPDLVRTGVFDASDVESLPAIEFHHIPTSVYDKGGTRTNKMEARMVAEQIIEHYKNNQKNGTAFSLGVVAFSEAQSNAISNELEKIFKQNPDLELLIHKFDEINNEPLLLKNLENIQGDERDFIFFSIGFGKDEKGNFSLNFGPINKNGGERRLNVAITRARYHVKIFCSFLPGEFDISKTQSAGVHRLFEYLEYARLGNFTTQTDAEKSAGEALQDQFISSVYETLKQKGYIVERDVGRSKQKIDLAIVNPEDPNRYLLGIMVDGGTYKTMESARDRDRVREEVLTSLGWRMFHIFAPEWLENKETILRKIDKIINDRLAEIKAEKEKPIEPISEADLQPVEKAEVDVEFEVPSDKVSLESKKDESSIKEFSKREKFLELPGVRKYEMFKDESVADPKLFERAPSRLKAARDIIKVEGPIHWELLEKKIKKYFALPRITPKISNIMEELRDSIPSVGDFYFPEKFDPNMVRIGVVPNSDPRKFEHISDMELQNALKIFLNAVESIDKDELYKQTLQLFGFPKRKEYLPKMDNLLSDLVAKGIISDKKVRGFTAVPVTPIESVPVETNPSNGKLEPIHEAEEIKFEEIVEDKPEIIVPKEEPQIESNSTDYDNIDHKTLSEIDFKKLAEIKIDDIVKTAEEYLESEYIDDNVNFTISDVEEILSDGQTYTFDELINELDITTQTEKSALNRIIDQLVNSGKAKLTKENGQTAWQII